MVMPSARTIMAENQRLSASSGAVTRLKIPPAESNSNSKLLGLR